ncbi:MAG: phosphoribosyltransferase [Dehalococcoidia bacterium]|nr:phosphoribosyltransferase [Dehalococcoidia bacterium]
MPTRTEEAGNLWLAKALWEAGAVRFGDFTIGRSTVHSPVYVNVRRIISRPRVLKRVGRVMARHIETELGLLRSRIHPFELVAGVPFGGLHVATSYSLTTNTPMIYVNPKGANHRHYAIEGHYEPDQHALIIDDLITSGGSVLETATVLKEEGLQVRDVMVLIDRGEGATDHLRRAGFNLTSLLTLEVMLNYYLSTGRMDQSIHKKCCDYILSKRQEAAS